MGEVVVDDVFELDVDLLPWDQQPTEADEHYAAFRRYIRLAMRVDSRTGEPKPRNVQEMADDVKWSPRHLKRVSVKYLWVKRARAWDEDREADLGGKIADARIKVMRDRLDLLEEIRGLTLDVLKDKDPADWKIRDILELLKIQLVAEDNLLGIAQRGAGGYNGVGVGVDISLPIGQNTAYIEGQIDEIMNEINARGGVAALRDDEEVTDPDDQ